MVGIVDTSKPEDRGNSMGVRHAGAIPDVGYKRHSPHSGIRMEEGVINETGPIECSDSRVSTPLLPGMEMAQAVRGVCAAQLEPDDPCMKFLRNRGYDLEGGSGMYDFAKQPSPLGGKRWYVAVEVRGRHGEFLIDTGASHSMIGRDFYHSLAAPSDDPVGTGRVRAANGMEIRTYGRQVLPLHIRGDAFIVSPTIAELTDDGILGLDFCCLYGVSLDPSTGVLSIRFPAKKEVACVLRRVSGTATVVQTVRVAPQHVCNVLVRSTELAGNRMGIIEPDTTVLGELGLISTGALVQNPRWTVVPGVQSNPRADLLREGN